MGSLVNPGVASPNGGTQFFNPDQVKSGALARALTPQAGQIQPSISNIPEQPQPPGSTQMATPPTSFTQPPPNLPQLVKPTFEQAASVGSQVPGAGNAASPALTKAGKLATLLTSGLQGALAGRAASEQSVIQSGGRRSGGAGMGFEAGYMLPWQRAEAGQQLAQQQAQTALTRAQADMVPTPYGMMPAAIARFILPAEIRGQAQQGVAQTNAASRGQVAQTNVAGREAVAGIGAQNRLDVEAMKFAIQNGQIAHVEDGRDPQTSEIGKVGYSRTGQVVGFLPGSMPSSAYLPKETDTVVYQQDADGNIQQLPKPSVTKPVLPGSAPPSGTPTTGAKQVTNASGQPMQGKGAAQQNSKWVTWQEPSGKTVAGPMSMARQNGAQNPADLPAQEVRDIQNARNTVNILTKQGDPNKPETQGVLQLIDSLDKDGKLGVLASRWNSFMTTGVGASPDDDPRIITLINKNMLGDTSAMLAHFGASGGRSPQMLQHFLDLANSRKMDGVTLRAGVKSIADYMTDKGMIPTPGAGKQQPSGVSGGFAAWKAQKNAGNQSSARP